MRVTYDPVADALYLYLAEGVAERSGVARTEEVAAGVMLDYDREDQVIGVEILSVSHRPGAKPMQMGFEVLAAAGAAQAAE